MSSYTFNDQQDYARQDLSPQVGGTYVSEIARTAYDMHAHADGDPVIEDLANRVDELTGFENVQAALGKVSGDIAALAVFRMSGEDGWNRYFGSRGAATVNSFRSRETVLGGSDRLRTQAIDDSIYVLRRELYARQKYTPASSWFEGIQDMNAVIPDGDFTVYQMVEYRASEHVAHYILALAKRRVTIANGEVVDTSAATEKEQDINDTASPAGNDVSIIAAWSTMSGELRRAHAIDVETMGDTTRAEIVHHSGVNLRYTLRNPRMPRWYEDNWFAFIPDADATETVA